MHCYNLSYLYLFSCIAFIFACITFTFVFLFSTLLHCFSYAHFCYTATNSLFFIHLQNIATFSTKNINIVERSIHPSMGYLEMIQALDQSHKKYVKKQYQHDNKKRLAETNNKRLAETNNNSRNNKLSNRTCQGKLFTKYLIENICQLVVFKRPIFWLICLGYFIVQKSIHVEKMFLTNTEARQVHMMSFNDTTTSYPTNTHFTHHYTVLPVCCIEATK